MASSGAQACARRRFATVSRTPPAPPATRVQEPILSIALGPAGFAGFDLLDWLRAGSGATAVAAVAT
jgi:hypothetical protein